MIKDKINVITCPKCGREYLPEEIFVPRGFFGNPSDIERDNAGKIVDFYGDSLDTKEFYKCDNCDTALKITAKVSFKAEVSTKGTFNEYYTTPLFDPKLTLCED